MVHQGGVMIVISAGLQKSGSGLYFNLTNDLLIAAGKQDIRLLRNKYNLESILKYANCNVGEITTDKLLKLLALQLQGNSFVVKTHDRPTKPISMLLAVNIVKATCIYRDPRDVLLSAMDHGKRIREKGENHSFACCTSVETTIPFVVSWLENSIVKWLHMKSVLSVKYEDLIASPSAEMKRLADHMNLDATHINLLTLYDKYDKDKLNESQVDYLHFNRGITNRFRTVLSKQEVALCNHHFVNYLPILGYKP
jgi:hypothetical protein